MIKFREKSRINSVTDKIIAKYLGWRGNMHNKIAQKLLSIGVSTSLMLAMVPNNGAFAEEPDKFVTSAYANHWGRSDLRAYLNNGLATVNENGKVSNKNYGIDSTTGTYKSDNKSGYAKQFSDAEYAMVQPFTYSTNVLDTSATATAVYETTDKFWLPSGNYSNHKIISWGAKDISANIQYSQTTTNDKDRIIPISYWSYGDPTYSWLRSPYYNFDYSALRAYRGIFVDFYYVYNSSAAAAAFKINLSSVLFASAASAANIVGSGTEGAKKIEISKSSYFGKKTGESLPDYGMYLKTKSNSSFTPSSLSLYESSGGTYALGVWYSGGVADQYVVVHAFKEDSLTGGHTSYVAAQKLETGKTWTQINVSKWGIDSLDGYTIKVWMEDNSGSLAKATMPVTFVGTEKKEDGASTNARVFAMKADLQTSWGKITNATDLVGANPTNQKIYFGAHDGSPLEFWIAGRETAANEGEISATGEIMTLYQAKSVEKKQFNNSYSKYKENTTVALQENQSATYTGSSAVYSGNVTYQNVAGTKLELPENNPTYQYSTDGGSTWTDGMPTNAGTYKIRAKVVANGYYESATSAPVTFIIDKKSITPRITAGNKDYDGNSEATVSVEFDGLVAGENLTLDDDYTIDSATFDNANAGKNKAVTATISLTESDTAKNYQLSSTQATTTANITKKTITPQITAENKDYDGTTDATVSVTFDGLQNNEKLTEGTDYKINSATFANANAENGKTVTATISLTGSAKAKNYQLSSNQATTTANINKKSITPRITAGNKDYDGNSEATVSVEFDGLVAGETLKKDVDYTIDSATFGNANAGENKTVTVTFTFLNNTTTAKNYQLSSTQATTANINKKSITPKVTVNSKEYDGTTDAEVVSVEFEGLVAGENLTLDDDYTIDSATFENVNAGENKTVTATISLTESAKAKNYQLSSTQATTTANITKKTITPQITAENKDYDGNREATVTVEFDSLVAGETLTLDDDYTIDSATFENANAENGKTVTATISLTESAKAKNYQLSSTQATTTANITKKTITPQITAEDKEYNGTNNATVSVTFDDLVDGETLKKDVDYTIDSAIFEDKEVGTEKTVTATVSLKNNNYTFIDGDGNPTTEAEISGVTASITPKSITVTADNQTKIEGEADPELTYTVDGLIEGDSLTGNLVRDSGEIPGSYNINQGTLENLNYTIMFNTGTFTIKPNWGTEEIHAGIKHYVDDQGMTSVEISPENMDENGVFWLREESYDPDLGRNTAAWYGLDNSSGIFQESSRFYVQWLNEQEHPEAFENIDEETRAEIENNNGWLFEVGVIAPDGVPYKQLEETIDFYVQIGDDWDESDLEGFYITLENDESVPVRYGTTAYPEGTDDFGIMSLSHFSPYFIYDKLSDEEKAQLDAAAREFAAQQEEKAIEANEVSIDESTQTSDEITYFTISGLGLIMTLALGLMINSKINKKKFD